MLTKLTASLSCIVLAVYALKGERASHFSGGRGGAGTSFSSGVASFAEWKRRDPVVHRHIIHGFIVALCVFVLVLNRIPSPGEFLGTVALCFLASQRMHTYYAFHVDAYAERQFSGDGGDAQK